MDQAAKAVPLGFVLPTSARGNGLRCPSFHGREIEIHLSALHASSCFAEACVSSATSHKGTAATQFQFEDQVEAHPASSIASPSRLLFAASWPYNSSWEPTSFPEAS